MRFLLLGNLEIYDEDLRLIRLSRTKHRQLLGLLLLRANHAVCIDQLVDGMWPLHPPRFAKGNIKTYVSALRPVVNQAGALIETVPRGYQLTVRTDHVDVLRFEELFQAGVGLGGDHDAPLRAELLQQALGLWRGEAMQDLTADGGPLRDAATRLHEKRIVAIQDLAGLSLLLGRNHEAIDHLRMALSWEPLRERLWRLLMLALYRDGRQAEALSAYREFRTILVENIGLEPSGELRSLHSKILTGDVPLGV
ncbi:AfsR/SARP family transcriptional regulator [Actinomadura barringtoniae]|uniref:AfsR/SARP family transcriptional regulator n=1 Tax=Actinomadura barringtoniae TaxID=1427535 RepID=A0A939T4R3_9ACTN|nr:AfsR/SARP family transcriptional regulator [Actinomadura barringtoniae]MBO2448584.1 AfsR/SARP family transcriptional regulator [Actinomadura barringtoniae]